MADQKSTPTERTTPSPTTAARFPTPWIQGSFVEHGEPNCAIDASHTPVPLGAPVDVLSLIVHRVNAFDALLAMVKELRAHLAENIRDCGPCDHAVNICVCGLTSDLDDADALLRSLEGK